MVGYTARLAPTKAQALQAQRVCQTFVVLSTRKTL